MVCTLFWVALLTVFALLLPNCIYADLSIDASDFEQRVIGSNEVFLIEFFSEMCGSCQEFAPQWQRISENSQTLGLQTAKINIDRKDNLALAQRLGVLDDGLPSVRLFHRKVDSAGLKVLEEGEDADRVLKRLRKHISGLATDNGRLQKKM